MKKRNSCWMERKWEKAAGIKCHSLTELPWKLLSQGQNPMCCNEPNNKNTETRIVSAPKKGLWSRQKEFFRFPVVPFMFTEYPAWSLCTEEKSLKCFLWLSTMQWPLDKCLQSSCTVLGQTLSWKNWQNTAMWGESGRFVTAEELHNNFLK